MSKTPFNILFIFKFLGVLLFIECFEMLLAAGVGFFYHEEEARIFLISAALTLTAGGILVLLGRRAQANIGKHESFVMVTLVWLLFSFFGALPFYWSGSFNSFTDAFFESISGYTTTGSSILTDIEALSHAMLFWRSIIQWFGGMGIIMLSLAIMPMLKFGNYQLFTAEVTGPVYEKIHPRLSETAKRLWYIYAGLTLLEVILLHLGGMKWFDAVCHSFTTMATGGFSTKNASIGHWNSTYIEVVTTVFMFVAGMSFILIYKIITGNFKKIKENEEFKWYVIVSIGLSLLVAALLIACQHLTLAESLRYSFFSVVSLLTTTGYANSDFSLWMPSIRYLLILMMCVGAMSGSTSGNIKVGRFIICIKTSFNEMKRDIHPNAVLPVMYNGKTLPASSISSLFGFLFFYMVLVLFSIGFFIALGLSMEESISVSLSSLGNVGPGMGDYFSSFAQLPSIAKWWTSFLMLVGRLEIYTVLLLFSRDFWSKA